MKRLLLITLLLIVPLASAVLQVTSIPPPSAAEGVVYTYDIEVNSTMGLGIDPIFENLSTVGFTPVNAPALDEDTGVFTWTPAPTELGVKSFSLTIRDGDSGIEPEIPYTFAITVVAATIPGDLQVSEILFDNVDRGTARSATFTVLNNGSQPLTNLQFNPAGIPAKYNASFTGTLPSALATGQQATVTLQIDVPASEDSGKNKIGTVTISSVQDTETVDVNVNPKSFLEITKFKIKAGGKSSSDFSIEKSNRIEIEVKNNGDIDMEDVNVEVKILDVDGSDLEEDDDIGDLDAGKDDDVKLEFDLRGEDIDEDRYEVEIIVTGETVGTDSSDHITIERRNVDIDLDNHNLVIRRASLDSPVLSCVRQTNLRITVENIGKNDEEDVKVTVKNNALGINLNRGGLEVDEFSNSDNELRVNFNLNLEEANPGRYALPIEVFRDEDRSEDHNEVTVEVRACSTANVIEVQNNVNAERAGEELRRELQESLQERRDATQTVATTSGFRSSPMYNVLLGILAVMTLIALILAIVVLIVKKK